MPLYYAIVPGATQTTNAAANTENDCLFVKPGTRTIWVTAVLPTGRVAAGTVLVGTSYRLKKWTSTASSGGSAITPTPKDPGAQASKMTAGFSASAVTPGTGGPSLLLSIGAGTSTPGPWDVGRDLDQAYDLEGSANQSMDVFNISGGQSQPFEQTVMAAE